jgi:hypothetical protein
MGALSIAVLLSLLLPVDAPGAVRDAVLVRNGMPLAALILPERAAEEELLGARELQAHIERMAGARLEITRSAAPPGMLGVYIGATFAPEAAAALREHSEDPAAFVLAVSSKRVSLVGNSPEGTLFAAYELLEQLGCRWYMPGELGTVIPARETVAPSTGRTSQTPSFPHRHLQSISGSPHPWSRRMRLGGLYFPGSHGIRLLPEADFEREPELFALVKGQRRKSQLCVSNLEVVRRAAAAAVDYFDRNPAAPWIGMGPNDGGGFCECAKCLRLDSGEIDPISGRPVHTDRYIWLFNQILTEVHKRHPGRKIAFYAYTVLKFPPRRQPVGPFLVPAFAPITHDRIHGMSNRLSPDRSFYRTIMTEWCRLVPETFERGYYFNLACPGLPFSKIHAVRDEIPVAHALGVKGWRVETMPSWAANGPTLYAAAKLMWDVEMNVGALLAEFYQKFFGPAAVPMGRYNKGLAWYRTEVEIPERFRGRRIFVWFGGMDEKARVWLNGRLVGESDVKTFHPFDFEVTEAVRFGAPNFLAVRVANFRLDELGTGGIVAPVMFWSPQGPGDLEAVFPETEE